MPQDITSEAASVLIVALVMLPVMLAIGGGLYLSYRKHALRIGNPVDQQQLNTLAMTAQRLEQRMMYLESVLDSEAPGWRSRSDQR